MPTIPFTRQGRIGGGASRNINFSNDVRITSLGSSIGDDIIFESIDRKGSPSGEIKKGGTVNAEVYITTSNNLKIINSSGNPGKFHISGELLV